MFKALYKKYQYFFNMLAVLVLVIIVRILDWLAWSPPSPEKTKNILIEHLFEFISFLPIILMLIGSYKWAVKRNNKLPLIAVTAVFVLLGPSFFLISSTWLEFAFWRKDVLPVTFDLIAKYSPGASLIIMFLISAFYLTHLIRQTARQKESAHKAETLAKDVQLKMLRYQINPHFLFNVLNSVYTLIDEDTEKARKLVLDMSEYFRYTLNKQQSTTTIEKETESVVRYLEIQKTRFEAEFQYEISVDEEAKTVSIPSFLIHLLIENAVKYGTRTEKHILIVRLSVRLIGKMLVIRVANTGRLLNAVHDSGKNPDGTGNGIENLKNRLALYYDDNYSFSLKEEEGYVVAAIEINNTNAR